MMNPPPEFFWCYQFVAELFFVMCSGDFRRSAAPLSSASSLLQKAKKKSRKRREKQLSILYFTQEKKNCLAYCPFLLCLLCQKNYSSRSLLGPLTLAYFLLHPALLSSCTQLCGVDKSSCGGEDFFAVSKRRSCIVNTKQFLAKKLLEMRIEQQGSLFFKASDHLDNQGQTNTSLFGNCPA